MKQYLPYVESLEKLIAVHPKHRTDWRKRADLALNGQPSRELRKSIALDILRADGAFFTQPALAEELIHIPSLSAKKMKVLFDPTCGAGDLLLAVARGLPLRRTLQDTLKSWGESLAGLDKHTEFVRATRARLAILAISRGALPQGRRDVDLEDAFPMIKVGDALRSRLFYPEADRLLLNPPFYLTATPSNCSWASGGVTAAALFIEYALERAKTGARLSAILPEVLRSGSRYSAWRKSVQDQASVEHVGAWGQFDPAVDVNIFLLDAIVTQGSDRRGWPKPVRTRSLHDGTVSDLFDIHVGPVVPHRHKRKGTSCPYIHAQGLPKWCSYTPDTERRKFSGQTFAPPFVVVRRTSRPDDPKRAIATVIRGKKSVAVENHLLVLLPRDGELKTCKALVDCLLNGQTDSWLNKRIRCRHLTVKALAELPWWRHM